MPAHTAIRLRALFANRSTEGVGDIGLSRRILVFDVVSLKFEQPTHESTTWRLKRQQSFQRLVIAPDCHGVTINVGAIFFHHRHDSQRLALGGAVSSFWVSE